LSFHVEGLCVDGGEALGGEECVKLARSESRAALLWLVGWREDGRASKRAMREGKRTICRSIVEGLCVDGGGGVGAERLVKTAQIGEPRYPKLLFSGL
jgi:hypothetical protein